VLRFRELAAATPLYSGADLASLCRRALLEAYSSSYGNSSSGGTGSSTSSSGGGVAATTAVTILPQHFEKALKQCKASTTTELVDHYHLFAQRHQRRHRPPPSN